jgi:DGQHR domain-containing protein
MPPRNYLRRRALRLLQDEAHPLYTFVLTGEELHAIADVSRLTRGPASKLIGCQRPEVKRHVQDIVTYLDGDRVLFPNSIILAISSQVRFIRSRGPEVDDGLACAGTLEIPLPADGEQKPAWIVDGQQRALALSKCRRKNFPVPVNAFVADEVELQRDQFLRVNNTHPLPRGLISELLPEISTALPARLAARKLPSALCDWLNTQPSSPFHGLIRRASGGPKGSGVVADTSVLKMIEESLGSPSGCLFPYRNIATNETDAEGICAALVAYWSAVRRAFPDAWGKPPHQSRLMHGAGIRSLGRLMDRVMAGINARDPRAVDLAERELRRVAPVCRWTAGAWEGLNDLAWNDVQNVPRHIRALSNLLIRAYVQAKGTG